MCGVGKISRRFLTNGLLNLGQSTLDVKVTGTAIVVRLSAFNKRMRLMVNLD